MIKTEILIIGAGAAGLAAAYELSLVNKKLIVLEARNRMGGRIHSINDNLFTQVVETGAEFIHGKLPVTLNLLKKAGIKHHRIKGKMWQVEKGEIHTSGDFITGWKKLIEHLNKLKTDMSITAFLTQDFPGEKNKELRESVLKFVQGYDLADPERASSFALRDEWENEDDHDERINGGYSELINFLAKEINNAGNNIFLSHTVKNISWQKGKVLVDAGNEQFVASKVLVTIPLGVWQAEDQEGYITFSPSLAEKKQAAHRMGFGTVVKIIFQFKNQFWEDEIPNRLKEAGFIFSDTLIPTWWSQHPIKNGMLTGWLGGPQAYKLKDAKAEEIFEKALRSLCYIFRVDKTFIEKKLVGHRIINWTAEPFTYGAYSYATLDTHWAKKVLREPVEATLYFSGEALYDGTETGTVEGALANGIEVARNMIIQSK